MKAVDAKKQILNNKVSAIVAEVIRQNGTAIICSSNFYSEGYSTLKAVEEVEVSSALEVLGYKVEKFSKPVKRYKSQDVVVLGIFLKEVILNYEVEEPYYIVSI